MSDLKKIKEHFSYDKKNKKFNKADVNIDFTEMRKELVKSFSLPETLQFIKMIKICAWVEKGRTLEDACEEVPITKGTVKDWIRKAELAVKFCEHNNLDISEHHEYRYIDFVMFFRSAERELKYKILDGILEQGFDEWLEDEDGNKIQLLKRGDHKALQAAGKIRETGSFTDRLEIGTGGGADGMGQKTGIMLVSGLDVSKLKDMSDVNSNSINRDSQQFLLNKVEEEGLKDNEE